MVRVFAGWLQGFDPRTEVPPPGLITSRPRRTRPYIYTDDQIAEIVTEAGRLPSSYGLRGWTCSTLFGLIAVTGLRVNEALGLDEEDVDLNEAVLTIRRGEESQEPLRSDIASAQPNGSAPIGLSATVSSARAGRRSSFSRMANARPTAAPDTTSRWSASESAFASRSAFNKHGRGPRIHDLRHTFAVRTIMDWYRRGLDPDREMLKLSTYLGHSKPELTYWYIEAIPELLQLACERAERNLAGREAR